MAKVKKRSKGVSVDFSGVESGGGRSVPDGRYPAKIHKIEEEESSSGNPMLKVQWKITGKKCHGSIIYDNVSLLPQALWRLKTMLECLGEEVPDSEMDVDLDSLTDREAVLEITNEKYQGKDRPKVTGFDTIEGGKTTDDEEEDESESEEEEEAAEEEEEKTSPAGKPEKPSSKSPKLKVGQKVKFSDEDENVVRGVITEIEDDVAKVEDKKGEEWEVPLSDLEAA